MNYLKSWIVLLEIECDSIKPFSNWKKRNVVLSETHAQIRWYAETMTKREIIIDRTTEESIFEVLDANSILRTDFHRSNACSLEFQSAFLVESIAIPQSTCSPWFAPQCGQVLLSVISIRFDFRAGLRIEKNEWKAAKAKKFSAAELASSERKEKDLKKNS